MIRIRWPVALATLFLVLFGWYLIYTQSLLVGLNENQALTSEVFSIVQELIQDTSRSERLVGGRLQDVPLFDLQEVMIRSGIPMIIISTHHEGPDCELRGRSRIAATTFIRLLRKAVAHRVTQVTRNPKENPASTLDQVQA